MLLLLLLEYDTPIFQRRRRRSVYAFVTLFDVCQLTVIEKTKMHC